MTSARQSTLKNGNPIMKPRNGRDEVNNYRKEMLRIGEERCLSLYNMQLEMAENAIDENNRRSAQQFLLDKVLPKALPGRYIKITLSAMNSLEDIKENEKMIMQHACDGAISLEEAEKLYAMTEQSRKTYEANEIAIMLEDMDKRMKEQGI